MLCCICGAEHAPPFLLAGHANSFLVICILVLDPDIARVYARAEANVLQFELLGSPMWKPEPDTPLCCRSLAIPRMSDIVLTASLSSSTPKSNCFIQQPSAVFD